MNNDNRSELEQWRDTLDAKDAQLKRVLEEREYASKSLIKHKIESGAPVYDARREAQVASEVGDLAYNYMRKARMAFKADFCPVYQQALPKLELAEVSPLIAGPCSFDTIANLREVAKVLKNHKCAYMRAGAWKPRTSAASWQGFGQEALGDIVLASHEVGLECVVEVVSEDSARKAVSAGVDVLQVGSRNGQNYELLRFLNKLGKPVLLKRTSGSTVEEWMAAAGYLDNVPIALCERGVSSNDPALRNRLDLAGALLAAYQTGLQVIVDTSHATGSPLMAEALVPAVLALRPRIVAAMIEVHPSPSEAKTDADQALDLGSISRLLGPYTSD